MPSKFVWGGVGGGLHSIMSSPQLRFVLELGCDNCQYKYVHTTKHTVLKSAIDFDRQHAGLNYIFSPLYGIYHTLRSNTKQS